MVILLSLILGNVESADDNWEAEVHKGLLHLITRGRISEKLRETLSKIEFSLMFPKFRQDKQTFLQDSLLCKLCNIGVGTIITARRLGTRKDRIFFVLTQLCRLLIMNNEEVCDGFLNQNLDTLLYIIDNRPFLRSSKVCSILLQDRRCKDLLRRDWSLDLPRQPSNAPNSTLGDIQSGSLKLLHITDIHYDPQYSEGSNADCGGPICCQKGTVPESESAAAGYWGDYRNCDSPWYAILDLLEQLKKEHKDIAYVYFTGDIINHKVYDTNMNNIIEDVTKVHTTLKETFGDIPVFPILGNHETHPVNQFSSEDVNTNMEFSTKWVFRLVADVWGKSLPASTTETILRGGYYTVLVRPGFRIIALNSNVCYIYNFWLLYDDYDPFGQLQWLIDTLLDAETHNEMVHILSHVPSGDSTCYNNWAKQYVAIVNRFSHIIAAQFNGHTHFDDIVIYYSSKNRSEPINIAFNGGSTTTYAYLNPNYKVYDVNAEDMHVTNFESWMYNITDANDNFPLPPKWYKLYDFKNAYNVSSLHPQELSDLVERMTRMDTLTQSYFRYKHREATNSNGCNSDCELENICTMVTSAFDDDFHCKKYTKLYYKNRSSNV